MPRGALKDVSVLSACEVAMSLLPRPWIVGLLLAATLSAVFVCRDPAAGCAPAPPPGSIVQIASESAVIVWDGAAKREHFIRRAAFETAASDFGFLVPTPAKPELIEVDQVIFSHLAEVTAPRVEYVKRPRQAEPGCASSANGFKSVATGAAPNAEPSVRVLDEKQIAGQDVAVLEADDADSLQVWLKEHGYEFSSKLKGWVEPYLEQKWVITAFKYAKPQGGESPRRLNSSAVRMSFDADRPFYPYREPTAEEAEGKSPDYRLLRIYLIASEKMQGQLDAAEPIWPGEAVFAKPLAVKQRARSWELLKLSDPGEEINWWLTEFEDRTSPRPGSVDLYFSPAEDAQEVERPPIVQFVQALGFPLDLSFTILAAGVLLLVVPRLTAGARSKARPQQA